MTRIHSALGSGHLNCDPRGRKRAVRHDERRYDDRWHIEAAFCRLKDLRLVAIRCDKLTVNFRSAVILAAIIAF